MTREEAMCYLNNPEDEDCYNANEVEAYNMAIKALKQKLCEDAVSREDAIRIAEQGQVQGFEWEIQKLVSLPSVQPKQKTGHCKDCKWWKDSDGIYRRGIEAESKCPINRIEVFEGSGYCYMFEPQKSEE